jgi:hypothetical protein
MVNETYHIMDALGWNPGFFCSYQSVIGFLNYCEQNNITGFEVFFEKGLYFDGSIGPNWWEYYFEPIKFGGHQNYNMIEHMADMQKSHWGTETISTMSKNRANELINKYIKLRSNIQSKIDDFSRLHFQEKYIVGIHYRGNDKSSEAPRVAFEVVFEAINNVIRDKSNYKIFVATDEQLFLDYMIGKFGGLLDYTNSHRSKNNDPIHHIDGRPTDISYILGEEAVIDCYLLSQSDIMIRTFSNLSSSAANINPLLPVIDLNKATYRDGLR